MEQQPASERFDWDETLGLLRFVAVVDALRGRRSVATVSNGIATVAGVTTVRVLKWKSIIVRHSKTKTRFL